MPWPMRSRNAASRHAAQLEYYTYFRYHDAPGGRTVHLRGFATLNNNIMPTVAAFLTYMKGWRPKSALGWRSGRTAGAGRAWGRSREVLKTSGCDTLLGKIAVNYVPDDSALTAITQQLANELTAKP